MAKKKVVTNDPMAFEIQRMSGTHIAWASTAAQCKQIAQATNGCSRLYIYERRGYFEHPSAPVTWIPQKNS